MMGGRSRRFWAEALLVAALFGVSYDISHVAIGAYRAAGVQPFFYQSNFEPAVMMACGRGFGVLPLPSPELSDFLQSRRNTLDCRVLPAGAVRPTTLTANANWYYMYDTAAAVWRVTGVSWTALDILVAAFAGIVTTLLYGLFRMVAAPGPAVVLSLLLTIGPANLMRLLSLRDYSKAPFAVAGILILAVMVIRPMSRAHTLALAALYGAIVGLGYGFRSDLAVMVPFGAAVVLLLLPGHLRGNIVRNALAAFALVAAFGVVAAPVIAGLKSGGCQYHFALLGLTGPATTELHLTPPIYRLGNHALDIFGNLKVGDYTTRVMHTPLTEWCGAEFDVASGQFYFRLARMFPADFAVRAYGSVLMILRLSFGIPAGMAPWNPFPASAAMTGMYRVLDAVTAPLAPLGVFAVLAAIAVAWGISARLGIAFTLFVLFLTGYPAIRFEERHWFHLRFIPWWAASMVIGLFVKTRARGWDRAAWRRAAAGSVGLLVALGVSLAVLRAIQTRSVRAMIAAYLDAPTEDLPIEHGGSRVAVRWQPRDYGGEREHRGSDLVVVTLDAGGCSGTGPLRLVVRYDVDTQDGGHDLSTAFTLGRPEIGAKPTRVFIPVFWAGTSSQTFLRFSGFEVVGAPTACVGRVGRVIDGDRLPLWLEVQVPADWSTRRLYQTIEPPRFLKPFIKGSL